MKKFNQILFIVLLFLPLVDTPHFNSYDALRTPLLIAITFILFLCIAFNIIKNGEITVRREPTFMTIIVFCLFALLSVFNSINPWESVLPLGVIFCFFFIYWFITNDFLSTKFVAKYGLIAITIVGFIIALYGILQKIGIEPWEWIQAAIGEQQSGWGQRYEPVSTLGNTNYVGCFIAIILPLVFGICFTNLHILARLFFIVTAGLLFIHLVISNSRAGLLGSLCGLVFVFLILFFKSANKFKKFYINRLWTSISLGAIVLVLTLMMFFIKDSNGDLYYKRISTIFNSHFTTNRVRILIWENSIKMAANNPIGVGIGNYEIAFQSYRSPEEFLLSNTDIYKTRDYKFVEDAHNSFVQLFSETGIFGILIFLFLVYVVFRRWLFFIRIAQDKNNFIILVGLFGGIIGFLVAGFFNSIIVHIPHSLYFWIFVGFQELIGNLVPRKHTRPTGNILIVIITVFFFIGCFLMWYSTQSARAEYYAFKGEKARAKKSFEEARKLLELSSEIRFQRWQTAYVLGDIYDKLGKHDDAIIEYRHLLDLHPNHVPGINNFANVLASIGRRDDTTGKYDESLKRYNEAITYLKRATEISSSYYIPYFNLGGIFVRMKKYDEAKNWFKKSLEIEPNCFEAYLCVAEIYLYENKIDEMIDWLEGLKNKKLFSKIKEEIATRVLQLEIYKQLRVNQRFLEFLQK